MANVYTLCGSKELDNFVREKHKSDVVVNMITVTGRVWLTLHLAWDARRCRYIPSRDASFFSL
jgi:hypothetical protein